MTLKVNFSVETDETGKLGEMSGRNVASVDATACGDETQAVTEALAFMARMDIQRLRVRYGVGSVELRTGDDVKVKTDELFYNSICFSLYDVSSFQAEELKFGNPSRSCDIGTAAHSALRIAKRFDKNVTFKFNDVAVPPVKPPAEITQNEIRAVVDAYSKANEKRPHP